MSTINQTFLNQFSSSLVTPLIEFGKRINDIEADVIMLMARKAACFVECLEVLGLTSLTGVVTSNRVLDLDTSWLRDKHVALIDDTLFSGKTAFHVIRDLETAGVSGVSLHVFCVNSDWWSPKIASPEEPYLRLGDKEATCFGASIVNAISLIPRPYSVDFPIFEKLRIPVGDLGIFSTLANWEIYDLSSSLQKQNGVVSLTFIPTKYILDKLDSELGWSVSSHSQLIKIRVYGKLSEVERSVYWFKILPIVAIDPLTSNQVRELWASLQTSLDATILDDANLLFTTTTSQLRLIQYTIASSLAQIWYSQIKDIISTNTFLEESQRNRQYSFPRHSFRVIDQIIGKKKTLSASSTVETIQADFSIQNHREPSQYKGEDYWSIQARLVEPFIKMYDNELAAHVQAHKTGTGALTRLELEKISSGLSLPQIRQALADLDQHIDVPKMVSLFLDISIDRGIVVPNTADVNGIVYRAYRHGEDIRFSLSEQRLCCLVLDAFCQSTGRDKLPHLWVEKLFVLLLRIGLHKQFLNRWLGKLGQGGGVGIRYYLKGAVVQRGSPKLYQYNSEASLTNLFMESGYLLEDPESGLYRLSSIPPAPVKNGAESEAEIIGHLFGVLLSTGDEQDNPLLNDNDLTLIASCLFPNDAAAALAGSIDFFTKRWTWRCHRFKNTSATKQKCLSLLKNFRSDVSFEAINSGAWKFDSFMSGDPQAIIERVKNALTDTMYKANWKRFWPDTVMQRDNNFPQDLRNLITIQGLWCIKANILTRMLEVSLRYIAEELNSPDKVDKQPSIRLIRTIEEILDFKTKFIHYSLIDDESTLQNHVDYMVERITKKILNPHGLREYALQGLDQLLFETRAIFDQVDTIVNPLGVPNRIYKFIHALYIDIGDSDLSKEECWHRVSTAAQQFKFRARRKNIKPSQRARLEIIPEGQGVPCSGRWICSGEGMSRAWLIRLADHICKDLCEIADVRFLLIANLYDDEQILLAENNTEFIGINFWEKARILLSRLPDTWNGVQLLAVTNSNDPLKEAMEKEIRKEMDGTFRLRRTEQIETSDEDEIIYNNLNLNVYTRSLSKDISLREEKDLGIITIVTEETMAVVSCLEDFPDYIQEHSQSSGRIFHKGSLPNKSGGYHSVVCTQQLQRGNRSVAQAYNALCQEYSPRIIILVGIAGSINKDVDLCDVIIADQIIYYDERKVIEDDVLRRGQSYQIPSPLRLLINQFFVEHGDPAAFQASSDAPISTFKVFLGPIGSGEAVIGYRNAEEREWLLNYNDKTVALETESGGLAQAFYEGELQIFSSTKGYLVVRGISDHADKAKDDKFRKPASHHAMKVIKELFQSIPDLDSMWPDKVARH